MLNRKIINLLILVTWLPSFILTPAEALAHRTSGTGLFTETGSLAKPTAQIAGQDPDYDGLTSTLEQAGWFNAAGGPFYTNPNIADSDGDGLSDGEEMLFDSDPLNDKSPGIYVLYRDEYQTKKFYPWRRYGNKFIVHNNTYPSSERDIITRRGTTVYVGGPPGATLSVSKSTGSLTSLYPQKNSCGSGWAIPIPENGTTGTYYLTATDGSWSRKLTMHVVFQLDTPQGELTQEHIDMLTYNDDLEDEKDIVTIYWDTSYEKYHPEKYNWKSNKHDVYGWGIGWETDYNERYVVEDYVMPAIQGYTSRNSAIEHLRDYTNHNAGIEFNAASWPNSTRSALTNYSYDQPKKITTVYTITNEFGEEETVTETEFVKNGIIDADCNGHAGVLTSFYKAAGITSRPVAVDWRSSHYDTSTEVWMNGEWRVTRGYSWPYAAKTRWDFGHPAVEWNNGYSSNNDAILVIEPGWEWDEINVNYLNTKYEDYYTERDNSQGIYPVGSNSWIYRQNWVGIPSEAYWGKQSPTVLGGCEQSHSSICNRGFLDVPEALSPDDIPAPQTNGLVTHPEIAHFGQVVADYGIDRDGDGLFDQLAVEVEVVVNEAGNYAIDAILNDTDPETQLGVQIDAIDIHQEYRYFSAGTHIVPLYFEGTVITEKQAQGPYELVELTLSSTETVIPGVVDDAHRMDQVLPSYVMTGYDLNDFDKQGADLSRVYTHQAQDTNGDGLIDRLVVETNLDMADVENYTVRADLTNQGMDIVAEATWQGDNGQVALVFEADLASTSPYYLRNVELYDSQGRVVDSHGDGTAQFQFDNYAYTTGSLYGGFQTLSEDLTIANVISNDSDSDGDIDSLDFVVNTTIAVDGTYTLAGWLESSTGALLAYRTTETTLAAGTQQITLSFDGQSINDFRANGPYKLVALKLTNLSGTVIAKKDVAHETGAFAFSDFDGANNGALFIDGMEANGPSSHWNVNETQWSLTTEAAHTPIQSWTDSPGGSYSANNTTWLTSNPVDISAQSSTLLPVVSFQGCYNLGDGDAGLVQVRANSAGDWINLTDFTDTSAGWNSEDVPLAWALNAATVEFRFGLTSDGSDQDNGWYVDDVMVTFTDDADGDGIPNADEDGGLNRDTDNDGNPDYADIDADGDGFLDSDEGTEDIDGDGDPNYQDLDSDGDTMLDADEGDTDTDTDGIPDYRDTDSDSDGISDYDEADFDTDTDEDGTPDFRDLDSDNDTIADSDEGPGDTDGDGTPDFRDLDSDGGGQPDSDEGNDDIDFDGIPNFQDLDTDGDGLTDDIEGDADTDSDGIPDYKDNDHDNDTIPDYLERVAPPTDTDGIPNELDDDSDGDTISDKNEWAPPGTYHEFCTNPGGLDSDYDLIANCQDNDIDGDGIDNYLDLDSDGDGLLDADEVGDINNPTDTDGDGIPDVYDSENTVFSNYPIGYIIRLPIIFK